jgi:hypothetical protein
VLVDGSIGGSVDETRGGDRAVLEAQVKSADLAGLDGVWSTEVGHTPFLSLLLAALRSPTL